MENKTNQNNGSGFKHIPIEDILNPYKGYMLTPITTQKIIDDYKAKEAIWMNEERMDD